MNGPASDRVKIVTLIVLGVIALAAVAGLVITAIVSERDLAVAARITFAVILAIALIGGIDLYRRKPGAG